MYFSKFRKTIIVIFLMSLAFPLGGVRAEVSEELVKVAGDSSVYLVKDGERHVFPHEAIYLSWGYPFDYSTTETILEETLNAYTEGDPVPFRTGYMFRGTSASLHGKEASAVFIADGSEIRSIFSGDVYQTLFNDSDWSLVTWIPDDFLSKFSFELGEMVLNDNLHPNGVLIEYNEYPDVRYLIEDGKKRLISDAAFTLNGFDESRIVKQPYLEYEYSDGEDLEIQEEVWSEPFVSTIIVEPEPEPEDTTVYTSYSQKHISSIEYPEGWEIYIYFNSVDNRHEIYFENPVADGEFGATFKASVAVVFEGNIDSPSTMEDYKKVLNRITFLDSIVYNDLTTENQGDAVVNDLGLTEKDIEFMVEKKTRNIKQKVYDMTSDEEEIYVVMSALEGNWADYGVIFDHIYESFTPETDQGFSDRDDLEVTGWGFVGVDVPTAGTEDARAYMDVKNIGDTEIDLSRAIKCKLTVTLPDQTELTQELNLINGASLASGGSIQMKFNPITVEQIGQYTFRFDVNSDLGLTEADYDNNYNDPSGRKVRIE